MTYNFCFTKFEFASVKKKKMKQHELFTQLVWNGESGYENYYFPYYYYFYLLNNNFYYD